VWGSAANDVWAAADTNLRHFNGSTWSTTPVAGVLALWGSSASDVWAVGGGRLIEHFDGSAWAVVSPMSTVTDLVAVAGTDAANVWAAGSAGTVLHWDGSTWVAIDCATTINLLGASSPDGNEVWAVGQFRALMRLQH
jgi:hypothetical protein